MAIDEKCANFNRDGRRGKPRDRIPPPSTPVRHLMRRRRRRPEEVTCLLDVIESDLEGVAKASGALQRRLDLQGRDIDAQRRLVAEIKSEEKVFPEEEEERRRCAAEIARLNARVEEERSLLRSTLEEFERIMTEAEARMGAERDRSRAEKERLERELALGRDLLRDTIRYMELELSEARQSAADEISALRDRILVREEEIGSGKKELEELEKAAEAERRLLKEETHLLRDKLVEAQRRAHRISDELEQRLASANSEADRQGRMREEEIHLLREEIARLRLALRRSSGATEEERMRRARDRVSHERELEKVAASLRHLVEREELRKKSRLRWWRVRKK